jgi:hypothetical protein
MNDCTAQDTEIHITQDTEILRSIDRHLEGIEYALEIISTVLSRCEGKDDANRRFIRTRDATE